MKDKGRERNLKNDDAEHDEKANSNDNGEGEEIGVDIKGLVVGQDDTYARVLFKRE